RPPYSCGQPMPIQPPLPSSRSHAARSSNSSCSSPGPPRPRTAANSPVNRSSSQSRAGRRNASSSSENRRSIPAERPGGGPASAGRRKAGAYDAAMPEFQTADDLRAAKGQHLGHSDWVEITQERVDRFADATGDHQWIHVDPQRAKDGPFGGTIAHGYLTLS